MDESKYVCEPHYDEKGNFDYWNPLFPYKRDTCEGCAYDEPATHLPYCVGCSRDVLLEDKWVSPKKVVE